NAYFSKDVIRNNEVPNRRLTGSDQGNGLCVSFGYDDTAAMNITMNASVIPITVKSIYDVLGLPMGGVDLNSVDPSSAIDDIITAWRKQFSKDRMRLKDVMTVVQKSGDSGAMFKISFLVIVINTLAECSRVGVCNLHFLSRIRSLNMIPHINWCKYIFDCIAT
ncbi:hypothetical protein Ccrd_026388, partial [Cynara cardunculus var. scolymus]